MPTAVPSGKRLIRITVDFRPVFPVWVLEQMVLIEQPPADALDRLLSSFPLLNAAGRRRAAAELGAFPGEGARAVPVLLGLTRDDSREVRVSAIRALGHYPGMAASSIPRLLEILVSGAPEDGWAAFILGKIGASTPEVRAALEVAVRSKDEPLREDARGALEALKTRR